MQFWKNKKKMRNTNTTVLPVSVCVCVFGADELDRTEYEEKHAERRQSGRNGGQLTVQRQTDRCVCLSVSLPVISDVRLHLSFFSHYFLSHFLSVTLESMKAKYS